MASSDPVAFYRFEDAITCVALPIVFHVISLQMRRFRREVRVALATVGGLLKVEPGAMREGTSRVQDSASARAALMDGIWEGKTISQSFAQRPWHEKGVRKKNAAQDAV